MLLPLACLKRYFLQVLQRVSLCSIIRVKSFPPCWQGQKEDICPSIKKSMVKITFRLKLHNCLSKSEKSLTQLCPSPACVVFKGKFLQLLMADSCRSKNCFRILSSMFFGSLFEGPRSSVLLSCTGHLFLESVPIFKIL